MNTKLVLVCLVAVMALSAAAPRAEASMLQTLTNVARGVADSIAKVGDPGTFLNRPRKVFSSAAKKISPSNVRCVLCQYMVQRIHSEMLINGIGGGVPFGQVGTKPLAGVQGVGPFAQPADAFTPPPPSRAGEGSAASSAAPTEASFLEVDAQEGRVGFVAQLRNPFAQSDAVKNWKAFWAGPGQWKTGRARTLDMLVFRPTQRRFSTLYDGPLRAARRAQERFENNQMYAIVYRVLESMCTQKMPKPFYPYCGAIMQNYQAIVNGLKWKDRPDAICMEMDMCDINSYVQQGSHATYRDY